MVIEIRYSPRYTLEKRYIYPKNKEEEGLGDRYHEEAIKKIKIM
jgi:hypothetical protein